MAFLNDEIYGDTAQIQHATIDAFGSGRLVAKNLILTARHVVLHPDTEVAVEEDWKVRWFSERPPDQQQGVWGWRKAKVVWRGKDSLDLALLEVLPGEGKPDAIPRFQTRIARVTHLEHHPVVAFGFPRGTRIDGKRSLFVPYGDLDDEKGSTLAFAIDQAYQPESPNEDWRGFSGSSVVLFKDTDPGAIWIYGVAQSVPVHFTHRLDAARLAWAWNDPEFRSLWAISQPQRSEPADPLHPNWSDFVEACQNANKNQVDLLAETRRYEKAVAVSRSLLEKKIEAFLQTEKPILALVGQTGTGKTFLMAHFAATAMMPDPILLLLAQKLDLNESGIQESVFRALAHTSPRISLLNRTMPKRHSADRRSGDLIVLLDGLNEAPVVAQTIVRWLQASLPWMKANRTRLIVTSLPETWALVSEGIPKDDLYFESSAAKQDLGQAKFVLVSDFNEEEALNAAGMYALDPALIDNPAFRHPLTLRMLRDGSSWKQSHSIFDLFRDYFKAVFARVRSTSQSVYSDAFCWSAVSNIARSMWSRSSLWIDPEQYFEIFGSAVNLANSFIASHLLVEGTDGLRFTFDELAFSLIASLPRSELEKQFRSSSMLEFASRDELFGESLPLILSRLEKEGDDDEVGRILSAIAQSEHSELSFTSFRAHRLFLRSIRYLRDPARYYEDIRQFVSRCAAVSSAYLESTHSLLPYCDLPALTTEQRYELLRLVALRESDSGWRWKDWEDLSYLEFWQGRTRTDFLAFVKHELDHNSQRFVEELFSWLQIATRLKARDSHPEARLMDLASGVLFFSGDDLLVTVTDRLARDFEKDGHQSLLLLFSERRRREMVVAIERWKLSRTAHLDRVIVSCASTVLGRNLPEQFVERLAGTVEEVLKRSESANVIGTGLGVLLRIPTRVEDTLETIEQLVQDPKSDIDPYIMVAVESTHPSRAFDVLVTIANNNPIRRQNAYYVMSVLVIPEDPTRVFKYLLSLPSLPSAGYELGLAFERALNKLRSIPSVAQETLSLFSRAFHSLSPSARKPMLHSVTPYGSLSSLDRQLLEIAVQSENDEHNLQHFLSMIPKIDLPFDEMFRLVQGVGLRQTFYPAGIAVLVAALEDHGFAEFVASINSDSSGPMSALSEFRDLTKSGSETREAIFEVVMRHRSEWP